MTTSGVSHSYPEQSNVKIGVLGIQEVYSIKQYFLALETYLLLLLLLSSFSCVQFCATPSTEAHQAPPSLGFSKQEHWSGLPFPSPMHESEKLKAKSLSRA